MAVRTWRVGTRAGHRLHVREHVPPGGVERDRAPFLLVHGLASNARLWDGVGAGLAAAGHRAVALDQRGHGHSERAADGPTRAGLLDDLVDVTTALSLARPVAVGQSWGGAVVLDLAADRPGVARSVACVDGGFHDMRRSFDGDHAAMLAALEPPGLTGMPYDDVVARITASTDGWPPAGTAGQLANIVRQHDGTATAALRLEDHLAILELLWERPPGEVAARVDVPVVLLPATAQEHPPADKQELVSAVADRCDQVRVHWATLAHHDVHAQRPDEVVGVLLGALADGAL